MHDKSSRNPARGFTLVELLVTLAVLGVLILIGMPALDRAIYSARVRSAIQDISSQTRAARLEAVKRSRRSYVVADFATNEVVVWREDDGTDTLTAGDALIRRIPLARLDFWGPADADPEGPDAVLGFVAQTLTFLPNGAALNAGAFRFGDGRGNFIEVRIEPAATGRVSVRKWNEDDSAWREQGEEGESWEWL